MSKISTVLALGTALMAALCCSPRNVEPQHVPGEYSHTLAVINEDYSELLVLEELSSPVAVTKTENLPYWLAVSAQEGLNKNNHPVLKLTVKKDAALEEDRKVEGRVVLSTGDVINLKVTQGADLPTGANADDVLTSMNTEFEADWASCKSISLVSTSVDINGRTQVTTREVALPWATGALTEEWLPEYEAENMAAFKDNWELVFNLTGIQSRPHYNYFGMYNKYTGKLRIFYYMDDEHMPPSGANDHMWSLYFSDALAEYPVFQYGVPYNVDVNNTYKQVVGSPNIQYMTSATTSQMSQSYKVTPRVGWWAYDVDLSQMRPTPMLSKNGYITPSLMLFNQDNVFLNSIAKGNIEGTITGNINLKALLPASVNKAGLAFDDIFGILSSFTGSSGVGGIVTGKVDQTYLPLAVSQGGVMAIFNMAGMISRQANPGKPKDKDNLGHIDMSAQLALNAEIETQGTIGGERSTNVSSPKIPWDYIKTGGHLGTGVWNIENHPVVYVLGDAFWSGGVRNFMAYEKGEEKDASGKVIRSYYKTVIDPQTIDMRLISFLDPTSIGNLRLNQDVYGAASSIQVNESYGLYPGAAIGYTKGFREGLGLSAQTTPISSAMSPQKDFALIPRTVDDDLFKYEVPEDMASIMAPRLSQQSDATNAAVAHQYFGLSMFYFKVNPAITEVDQVQYVVDPQVKVPFVVKPKLDKDGKEEKKNGKTVYEYFLYDPDYVDWVVTVSVRIEQDGFIHLLDRQYIPEVRIISFRDMPALLDQMRARSGQHAGGVEYVSEGASIERIQRYYNAIVQ